MKVLLLQDVYKLGRAGDIKRVADGFGRNYLIPQGLAMLATPGAMRQAEHIRAKATTKRTALNQEMSGVAEKLADIVLNFPMRASETDKLYGSVSIKMITDAIREKTGLGLERHQIDHQPIRTLGEFTVPVRLTMDLVPVIKVIVYREGQTQTETGKVVEVEAEAEQTAVSEEVAETRATIETEVEIEPEAEAEAQE
jgi:large subunit ribosomal protein L9